MCLVIIAHRVSSDYPLVLAANRDEFFARPTRQAHEWPDAPIIAGRDLRAGGAWLGVGKDGRFAAVTNVREGGGNGAGSRSRGELPLDFLAGSAAPAEFLGNRAGDFSAYAGFNLLVGDRDSVCYTSNRATGIHQLGPGVFGLSNGAPDSEWPKVARGREKLAGLLAGGAPADVESLLALMRDGQQAASSELPQTGISDVQEKHLSSMFIPALTGGYGTRCSSVFIRGRDGQCRFSEQNFTVDGKASGRHDFRFSIPDREFTAAHRSQDRDQFTRWERSRRSTPAS